jgi:hypothetical protein
MEWYRTQPEHEIPLRIEASVYKATAVATLETCDTPMRPTKETSDTPNRPTKETTTAREEQEWRSIQFVGDLRLRMVRRGYCVRVCVCVCVCVSVCVCVCLPVWVSALVSL